MPDTSTQYMGINLKNPIIAGSCGLTGSIDKVKKLEQSGAAAVVLKSIFEEEIIYEMDHMFRDKDLSSYELERYDYYDYQIRKDNLARYTKLIEECKAGVAIPVIASVNCTYSHDWIQYARQLQSSGADGLELNMFFLPLDFKRSTEETERTYFEIVEKIQKEVTIPIALKISHYFTNLGPMIQKMSNSGVSALVLFNRFFRPDIDIENFRVVPSSILSTPEEILTSLRWIAIMSQKSGCDLAASTGIHDGRAVIKQLLVGAKVVQVASALYRNGIGHIQKMLEELNQWMERQGFENIEQFRGRLSRDKGENSALYERVQFMKYYSGGEETV